MTPGKLYKSIGYVGFDTNPLLDGNIFLLVKVTNSTHTLYDYQILILNKNKLSKRYIDKNEFLHWFIKI